MTKRKSRTKITSLLLALVLTITVFLPIFSIETDAAAGDIQTVAGANSYSLFNSGSSSSSGSSYGSGNYNAASYNNGGYDVYAAAGTSCSTARLGRSFTVTDEVTERAIISIFAYDVDEESGERDYVYLVDENTGSRTKLSGYLSGMNNQWNTTTLYAEASYFTAGHTYHLEVYNSTGSWVVYVRTVAIRITTDGTSTVVPTGPFIVDHSFTATIDSYGKVSTSLYLKANERINYTLEYAASINGIQRGSASNYAISASSDGTTKNVSFKLESGAPTGVYQIDVIVKDDNGNMITAYTTTAGYSYYAVSYHSNGGSSNLPIDNTPYRSGNTVTVKFDYTPSKSGYDFVGWATSPTATEPTFTADGVKTLTIDSSDVALYAIWTPTKDKVKANSRTVLLIEDDLPWGVDSNSRLLEKLKSEGKIEAWNKISSSAVTASLLENYAVVYVAGMQSLTTYATLNVYHMEAIESYIKRGGVFVYGACVGVPDKQISLPFGVSSIYGSDTQNFAADITHPILTQLYSERILFPESALTGNSISGSYLTGLPEHSKTILIDSQSRPTLAEYGYGNGKVIATTQTWEYYYVNHTIYGSHRYSAELFDDLILYALATFDESEHTHLVNWIYDTEPTCTLGGKRHGECSDCGQYVEETLSPLGHSYENMGYTEPTCTEDGCTTLFCNECSSIKYQIIFATGHELDENGACINCLFAPEAHEHVYTEEITAPTCETVGYTTATCECGYSYRKDYVDQLGHRWDGGTVTLAKTCTTDGITTFECTVCQATLERADLASHSFTETVTLDATCTTDGEIKRVCDGCGLEEIEVIPASHVYDEGKIVTEPTCSTEGVKECTCLVCGELGAVDIPSLGHRFYDGSCQVCGATITDIVTPNESHPEYGMFFEIDDILSNYGPDLINEYGVLLDFNKDANIKKVAVFLVQEGNMWRRCIACVGENITYATYVPYLSYGQDIKYTGLNSAWINTFALTPNKDGIWCYSNYTTIGVNLADAHGNLLLSLYDIGQAGAKTKVFDDLDEMVEWLLEDSDCVSHFESDWIIDVEATADKAGARHKVCNLCRKTVCSEIIAPIAQVAIDSAVSSAGGTFEIKVSIKNNPGILGAIFELTYGADLELVEARAGEALGSLKFTAPTSLESGCQFKWSGKSVDDTDGEFLILVFKLSDGASDSAIYDINLSYAGGDLLNSYGTSMDVTVDNAQISVKNVIGDANNDGTTDVLDVIYLRRYLAGYADITPSIAMADMDKNGIITVADVILLRRMILGEA